jgi:hypothetical protein
MAREVRRRRSGEAGVAVVSVCIVGRVRFWALILRVKALASSREVE